MSPLCLQSEVESPGAERLHVSAGPGVVSEVVGLLQPGAIEVQPGLGAESSLQYIIKNGPRRVP